MTEIKSISEYASFCKAHCSKASIFRGVLKTNYKLIPSIGRVAQSADPGVVKDNEIRMLRVFRTNSHPYIKNYDLPALELLGIAQHHGMKTRLLDWTRSALAALFFACESDYDFNGTVYVLPHTTGNKFADGPIIKKVDPFELSENTFFIPYSFTTRVTAQQGLFLIFKNPLDEFIDPKLIKIVIPSTCKKDIKKDLSVLGINKASLFPDLDGLASFLNYTFE